MEQDLPKLTVHERICRLVAMTAGLLLMFDIAIYLAPSLERQCQRHDYTEVTGPAQLKFAFIYILGARTYCMIMSVIAQRATKHMHSIATLSKSQCKLQGSEHHSEWLNIDTACVTIPYSIIAFSAFYSAFLTRCVGYGSSMVIAADDCLYGTIKLTWFQAWLWLFHVTYLAGLAGLLLLGVLGTWFLGRFCCYEICDLLKECCSRKSSPQGKVAAECGSLEATAV